jgi:hypothetical protein
VPAFAGCRYTPLRIRSNPVTRPNHLPSSTGYKPAPLTRSDSGDVLNSAGKQATRAHARTALVGAVKPRLVECDSNWLEPGVPHTSTRLVGHEISLCSQAYLDNGRSRGALCVVEFSACCSLPVVPVEASACLSLISWPVRWGRSIYGDPHEQSQDLRLDDLSQSCFCGSNTRARDTEIAKWGHVQRAFYFGHTGAGSVASALPVLQKRQALRMRVPGLLHC